MNKKKLTKKIWYGSEVNASGQPIIPPLAKESNDLEGLHEGELFLHNSDEQPNIWIRTSGGRIVSLFKGGGGTAESISWINITDKPTWLVDGIIDYSEIVGAPDLSLYAKKSYVDSTFVTLSGNEDVSGIKNFTNGIKLSGIEFKYDSENNAVCLQKADGTPINFYVTGGMSMYGLGNIKVTSIMDAIAANLDPATLGFVNGKLTVIGGGSGGEGGITTVTKQMVIDALGFTPYSAENPNGYITAASIPSALKNPYALTFGGKSYDGSSAQSITASDLGAALSSDLSKYLPLSGGTISGSSEAPLTINSTNSANKCFIPFTVNGVIKAYVGYSSAVGAFLEVPNGTFRVNTTGITYNGNTVYHAGNFNPANYLPLSGGTIQVDNVGKFNIYNTAQDGSYVHFFATINSAKTDLGYIGINKDKVPTFMTSGGVANKIWHAGNDGSGSGLDADLLDGKHLSDILGSNVASATKLQTARTIWGQSFDGSGDISGALTLGYGNAKGLYLTKADGSTVLGINMGASDNVLFIGQGSAKASCNTYLCGYNIQFRYGTTPTIGMILNASGNLTISSSDLATTNYKLYVDGLTKIASSSQVGLRIDSSYTGAITRGVQILNPSIQAGNGNGIVMLFGKATSNYNCCNIAYRHIADNSTNNFVSLGIYSADNLLVCRADGNVGVGTTSPTAKLHVVGNILATGGITMQSQRSLKNVVDEDGLTLDQLKTIKPTRYTWKDKRDERIHIGGIADDIERVLPEVIYKTADGTLTMDYGNAGFAIASSLIAPVNNHEERIIDHDERIKALERENKELKELLNRLSA